MAKIYGVELGDEFFSTWEMLLGHEPTIEDYDVLESFGVTASLLPHDIRPRVRPKPFGKPDDGTKYDGTKYDFEFVDDAAILRRK